MGVGRGGCHSAMGATAGRARQPRNLMVRDGFGKFGHGFGMGAATGLIMSELVMDGKSRVDLDAFRLSRFTDGSPLELNAR